MKSTKIDELLKDGFTRKYATFYLNILKEENENKNYDKEFVKWAHERGYSAKSASIYGINDTNFEEYLSDYDYYRLWPINSWNRIWINDKLTLKYMLAGTEYDALMPEYYFYASSDGLRSLLDNPFKDEVADFEQFKKVLKEKKKFACKPCNGSTSVGFFKLEYNNGKFYYNDGIITESKLREVLEANPNYVFTEYLIPASKFYKMNQTIHTLRLVTINEHGCDPKIMGGYLRISHKTSSAANYISCEDPSQYNIFTDINVEDGSYGNAKCVYFNRAENILAHPDNRELLSGRIDDFSNLKEIVLGVAKRFNTIEYMGFDIGITENGFKCMEINSHPGIGYMQLYKSLFADEFTEKYFKKKIKQIDLLSEQKRLERVEIPR